MKDNIKTYDNLINQKEFLNIYDTFTSHNFPWFLNKKTTHYEDDNNFLFGHILWVDGQVNSDFYNTIINLQNAVVSKSKHKRLMRIKANLYVNQGKNITHRKHTDYPNINDYTTCVYNLTTTNGGTVFYLPDEEYHIPSVQNSLVVFDGTIEHSGVTQSDKDYRVLINFDYYED